MPHLLQASNADDQIDCEVCASHVHVPEHFILLLY